MSVNQCVIIRPNSFSIVPVREHIGLNLKQPRRFPYIPEARPRAHHVPARFDVQPKMPAAFSAQTPASETGTREDPLHVRAFSIAPEAS